jgi:Glycosyltransferase sugar-binding region containing DXD motif
MTEYHCFWVGPWRPLLCLSLCSLLKTQSNAQVVLWGFAADVADYRRQLRSLPVHIREFRFTVPDGVPFSTPVEKSDYARHIILYRHGGIYFDLDILWLKSLILPGEWAYRWSNVACANSAVMRLTRGSDNARKLFERGVQIGSFFPLDLYRLDVLRAEGISLTVHPCEWFDPAWNAADAGQVSFADFFTRDGDTEQFFPDALCYHWHNQWEREISGGTIAGRFWRKYVDHFFSKAES